MSWRAWSCSRVAGCFCCKRCARWSSFCPSCCRRPSIRRCSCLLGALERGAQYELVRRRQFCGRRWCWSPQVGNKVTDAEVGFMPHRGDHRDAGGGHRAGQGFIVEGPQVFQRAAAAADDQCIGPAMPVGRADGRADRGRRLGALHGDRVKPDFATGQRRSSTCSRSRTAAPLGEVTSAIRAG